MVRLVQFVEKAYQIKEKMFSKVVIALCIIGAATAQETFKDCLQKDSISCVQLSVRKIGLS